jgi:hypothetical protein
LRRFDAHERERLIEMPPVYLLEPTGYRNVYIESEIVECEMNHGPKIIPKSSRTNLEACRETGKRRALAVD